MKTISVTRDSEGLSGLVNIDIESIDYLLCESEKKRIVVYVGELQYYTMGPIKYWENAIQNSGDYRFVKVDRNTLVNIENVQMLDCKTKKAYFDSNKKNGCEFAHHKFSEYESMIKTFNKNCIFV